MDGFEDGMEDPFAEEADSAEDEDTDPTPETQAGDSQRGSAEADVGTNNRAEAQQTHSESASQDDQPQFNSPVAMIDMDLTEFHSPKDVAQSLQSAEYHSQNPGVPYAMWRQGTSTGRSRTTIELNPDVDDLVKSAMHEFEVRYDAEIHKADLREFAMAWGLMNLDDVFEMAEEWGLQYNN